MHIVRGCKVAASACARIHPFGNLANINIGAEVEYPHLSDI
jgi:hypothetical protein